MQIILKLHKHQFNFTIKLLRRAAPSCPIVFCVLKKVGLKSVYLKFKLVEIDFSSLMITLRRKSRSLMYIYIYIMIKSRKISIHRFIATTLFRVIKGWPHSSGNINDTYILHSSWKTVAPQKFTLQPFYLFKTCISIIIEAESCRIANI